MPSRALSVAIGASVLLVAVVAVDASMNRVYHVEAFLEGRWIQVATHPVTDETYARGYPSFVTFDVNASDDVRVRLRVDNGYPWAFEERFDVLVNGEYLFDGTLTAAARSEGVAETTVKGSKLFGAGYETRPVPNGSGGQPVWMPTFDANVGGERFGGIVYLREVP